MHIPVQKQRLIQDVETLCSIQPPRNYQNLGSLNAIADYIREVFREFGKDKAEVWDQAFQVAEGEYRNVICSWPGKQEKKLIIGAHYDVDGEQAGADDNASAVAGLLELARLIGDLEPDLAYQVDLVAYTLEEAPFFFTDWMGSAVHARHLRQQNAPVAGMVSLEMIGYFDSRPGSQNYPVEAMKAFYPSAGDFIAVVGRLEDEPMVQFFTEMIRKYAQIDVQFLCAPLEQVQDISRSDHINYWKQGYPAVMVTDTSFLRNPNYHQASDTPDTLDFDKMVEVVKGVYAALVNFA